MVLLSQRDAAPLGLTVRFRSGIDPRPAHPQPPEEGVRSESGV